MGALSERLRSVDRAAMAMGLPVGPFLVIVGYLVVLQTSLVVSDLMLVALAVWPTLVALLVAAVVRPHRRWWLGAAAGAAVGTVTAVVAVVVLISGLAYLLSDPGGDPA